MPRTAAIKCFAKLNLFLDVICKRPDGYHDVETILQTISLSDKMEIEITDGPVEIACDNPSVPTDERNLACQAFLAIRKEAGYVGGVRIRITKSIPPGSGLGGGSSNAAAALLALNRLLGAELDDDRLRKIAGQIGADVPFFISGGLAAAWGRGDSLQTLPPLPESFIALAIPLNVAVSTATAYGMLAAPSARGRRPEISQNAVTG